MSMLFNTDTLKFGNTIVRYCAKCNDKTEHECPRVWLKSKGKYRIAMKCLVCKRERQRIRYHSSENRRLKAKIASEKFMQSEGYDQRARLYKERSKESQKKKAAIVASIRAAQLLEQSIGATSDIYFLDCGSCGCKKVLRKQYRDGTICGYCYISHIQSNPIKRAVNCICCGKEYIGTSKRSHCCECKAKKAKEHNRIGRDRRKATERRATIAEPVDRLKVFERDKWKCRMCGVKVQTKKPNDSNAAQIDHIVPLSKGGVHTYSNVQCLCRNCNCVLKNDKHIGQMTMQL